jgi:predicted PurR-regulated permease PerM
LGYLSGRTNLAAVITLILILLLVVVPAILLGMALAQEAASLYIRVQEGEIDFGAVFEAFEQSLPHWMQVQLASYGYNDFASIRAEIEQIIPLGEKNREILRDKFLVVIRATIKGSLIIAIIQGSLGGLVFWALDIRGALLWAVLMGIFSLIPAIGTGFVWVPVALFLLITGDVWQGVVLIICGVFLISMVDNLVRPTLVGRDTRMPDYVVLISTLGGLQLFGINGIVIGPLVAALFIALWGIFSEMNGKSGEIISSGE